MARVEPRPGLRHTRPDLGDAEADIAAVAGAPTHISLYDLTYTRCVRQTHGRRALGAGEPRRAAAALAEEHYAEAVARLEAAGYRRYEVSNFALTRPRMPA